MSQVFVSHARRDSDAVEPIKTALRQAGLSVWDEATRGDDGLGEQLQRGLESTRCVIMVWSKAAAGSQWAQEEMRQAIRVWSSGRLVLAALDDSPLPIGLRDIAPIRVGGGSPSGVKQLVDRAKAVVAASGAVGEPSSATPIVGKSAPARESSGGGLAAILGALITIISLAGVGYVFRDDLAQRFRPAAPGPATPNMPDALPPLAGPSKPAPAKLSPLALPESAPGKPAQTAAHHAPTLEELAEAAPPHAPQAVVELPQATVATPYRAELPPFSDHGGKGLRLAAESLPQGVAFEDLGDGRGVIQGAPEQAGLVSARIIATNRAGRTAQMTAKFVVAERTPAAPPPAINPVPPAQPTQVAPPPAYEARREGEPSPADREGLFVRGYDGGDCFLVKPLPGRARAYLGVSDQLGPFVRFDEAFKREFGAELCFGVQN